MYCEPRDDKGPYTKVEVGFIEKDGVRFPAPTSWEPYADSWGDDVLKPLVDVFGYIPVDLVEAFIAEHGGCAF